VSTLKLPKNLLERKVNQKNGISRIVLLTIILAVIAISAVPVLYSYSLNRSSTSSCNTPSTEGTSVVQISITNGAYIQSNAPGYSPDNVTLVLGVNTTVVWKNNDSAHHIVTTSSAPSGASFSSGDISSGSCFTHTFTKAGTYKYYCTYHSWMTGIIIVKLAQ
jgi:plastocyanin